MNLRRTWIHCLSRNMPDILIQNIKEMIPAESWLELLQDNQIIKVYEMLKKGTTNSEIIKTVQYLFNIKRSASLYDMLPDLVKFRTKILDDKTMLRLEAAQENQAAIELSSRLAGLTSKVDALGRLNWLVDAQTKRVLALLDREAKTLPMTITTKNIEALARMLHDLLKAQAELGDTEKTNEITPENKEKLKNLVAGFKDDGEIMIQATRKLLELAEDRSLILNLDESGKYSIQEKKKENEENIDVLVQQ